MTRFIDTGASSSSLGDYSRGAATFFGNNGSTYTWTVPAGVTEVFVNVFGSGGRGNSSAASTNYMATGGGGGGYAGGALTVTAGSTYTITNGQGGYLQGYASVTDGTDTTFKDSDDVILLTGGGGKGGLQVISTAQNTLLGGAGGVGTVNSSTSFLSSFTANGGRGGNLGHGGTGSVYRLNTGGGASGSLSGDGGRGGDLFRGDSTSGSYQGTGGGGWAGGNGGDISIGTTPNTGSFNATGGGGYMHSGGSISQSTSTYDVESSGGSPFGGGQSFDNAKLNTWEGWGGSSTGQAPMPQTQPTSGGRRSWWTYMTGEALTGTNARAVWDVNGDGVGGWGHAVETNLAYNAWLVPGFGGGMGANSNPTLLINYGGLWPISGRGRMVGGGGGTHIVMDAELTSNFNYALDNFTGDLRANITSLGRVPFGGGSGSCSHTYPLGAGDGFVVICYK